MDTTFIIAMLGGDLRSCNISVISAIHHANHLSAIQKGADVNLHRLPNFQHHQRSDGRDIYDGMFQCVSFKCE